MQNLPPVVHSIQPFVAALCRRGLRRPLAGRIAAAYKEYVNSHRNFNGNLKGPDLPYPTIFAYAERICMQL